MLLIKKKACCLFMTEGVGGLSLTAIHFRDCRVEMALGRPFG